ncbi:hypothetical protein [Reinekea sp.]|uniref:hypothetical protein n=1 Tax=Reinekea sp. TaxID=1970455 RepID=UPI002A808A7E|nr:hypothetical protein [Reinekea sp.]
MNRRLIWLVAPIAVAMLAACDPVAEETTTTPTASTGGSATTDQGVEIALGKGSGSGFIEGAMSAATGVAVALSAGGTTSVTVNLVNVADFNSLYSGVPVLVEFESQCVASGKATFSNDTVLTSTGIATTTYQAEGCYGSDTITAKYLTTTASVSISVSPADVNSISFTGEGFVNSISYANSATSVHPNVSVVQFVLIDNRGNPVGGQTVSFAISSVDASNGLSLSNDSAISDPEGLVETRVSAGTLAANVRVLATYTPTVGDAIATQSPPLAVNTGPADSSGISLAISSASVKNAYGTDGVVTGMSVSLFDHHNNPVADGTVVSFWAEYGYIASTCITSLGSCSVDWTSGGKRPDDGLATITAYTVGEDRFIDSGTANGIYNIAADLTPALAADEVFISSSELYYDLNLNGYDSGSFSDLGTGLTVPGDAFYDYNASGDFNAFDDTNLKYRGALCSSTAKAAGHCAETSILVWDSSQIALNTATPVVVVDVTGSWNAGTTHTVTVTDSKGNFPPFGTSVTIEAIGTTTAAETEVYGVVGAVSFSEKSAFTFIISVDEVEAAGNHKITISFPDGGDTFYYVRID